MNEYSLLLSLDSYSYPRSLLVPYLSQWCDWCRYNLCIQTSSSSWTTLGSATPWIFYKDWQSIDWLVLGTENAVNPGKGWGRGANSASFLCRISTGVIQGYAYVYHHFNTCMHWVLSSIMDQGRCGASISNTRSLTLFWLMINNHRGAYLRVVVTVLKMKPLWQGMCSCLEAWSSSLFCSFVL